MIEVVGTDVGGGEDVGVGKVVKGGGEEMVGETGGGVVVEFYNAY